MSMPRAKMRSMKGTYMIELPKDAVIEGHHTHNYHGSKCPVLTSETAKCLVITTPGLKTCCDPCIFHGSNCTVGLCLGCWLYKYKKVIHHFMPDLPFKRRQHGPNWEKQKGKWVRVKKEKK